MTDPFTHNRIALVTHRQTPSRGRDGNNFGSPNRIRHLLMMAPVVKIFHPCNGADLTATF